MKNKYSYWYTYLLPFIDGRKFTYWKTVSGDSALGMAHRLYKTTEFHIEETTKVNYFNAEHKGN